MKIFGTRNCGVRLFPFFVTQLKQLKNWGVLYNSRYRPVYVGIV
jgi:hypothetical protein